MTFWRNSGAEPQNQDETLDLQLEVFHGNVAAKAVAKARWQLFLTAFAMIFSSMVIGYGFYDYFFGKDESNRPNVYLELKALTPDGHPIIGATVAIGQVSGVTDSFGEWRSYLKLKQGSTVAVSIAKPSQKLTVKKNLAIPLGSQGRAVKLVQSIRLLPTQVTRPAVKPKPTPVVAAKEKAKKLVSEVKPKVEETISGSEEAPKGPTPHDFRSVHIQALAAQKGPRGRISLSAAKFVRSSLVPALKAEMVKQGVRIDPSSPWKIVVRHVETGTKGGLVHVRSHYPDAGKKREASFLRNYLATANKTAARIAGVLRFQVKRRYPLVRDGKRWYALLPQGAPKFLQLRAGESLHARGGRKYTLSKGAPYAGFMRYPLVTKGHTPCSAKSDSPCMADASTFQRVSPRADWQRLRLKIATTLPPHAQVYVAGFKGVKVGANTWKVWGKPYGHGNVTILSDRGVRYRGKVRFAGKRRLAMLAIPAQTVARR